MTPPTLAALEAAGAIAPVDRHLAEALGRRAGDPRPEVALAAALASRAVRVGHVCLVVPGVGVSPPTTADGVPVDGPWPAGASWLRALAGSPVVGGPDEGRPMVLDGERLYPRRTWEDEDALAAALARRLADPPPVDALALAAGLARLFPPAEAGAGAEAHAGGQGPVPDLQRVAAAVAVLGRLTVVTGGPGTGKTTTVARILALLVEQASALGRAAPRVALIAPTGKAAARLEASLRAARDRLAADASVRAALPDAATTIHRALGARPDGGFGRDAARPLEADVVVVDEASMVDAALMRRLVDAVRPDARLVLLGDRDQLVSIEAGAVLGDVCGPGAPWRPSPRLAARLAAALPVDPSSPLPDPDPDPARPAMADAVVTLRRSWRFAAGSGIGALARAINAGDADAALAILAAGGDDVAWWPEAGASPDEGLAPAVAAAAVAGYAPALAEVDPTARLAAFDGFRVLCAHRRGPDGLEQVGAAIEAALTEAGRLRPGGRWVDGRPLLVLRNAPALRLANGDLGVTAPDPADPTRLRVWFPEGGGAARGLAPSRLGPHEPAWAMSIHKAQGSEFDRVVVMLPRADAPLLSRELLYTAVTRARRHVAVAASAEAVRAAVTRRIRRESGLRDRLWGPAGRPG